MVKSGEAVRNGNSSNSCDCCDSCDGGKSCDDGKGCSGTKECSGSKGCDGGKDCNGGMGTCVDGEGGADKTAEVCREEEKGVDSNHPHSPSRAPTRSKAKWLSLSILQEVT